MTPETDLANLTDVELLKLLCSSSDDALPYKLFVQRFLPELKTRCGKICTLRKLDAQIGQQIAHDCFERLRRYKSFKEDSITLPDRRQAVLAYLTRIATRLFNDHFRREQKSEIIHKTYLDDIQESASSTVDPQDLKKKKEITSDILQQLTPRERQLIIRDFEIKRHQKYLPTEVLDELAKEFKVNRESIRKIRERAITKINNAINAVNHARG